jgi:hypothetical protein
MASTLFPKTDVESQQRRVASLSIDAQVEAVSSAKTAYDSAVAAWVSAGSLSSGAEFDAKVAATSTLGAARASLEAARISKADEIAKTVMVIIDWQKAQSPNPAMTFGEVAKQIALALLPNASPDELYGA